MCKLLAVLVLFFNICTIDTYAISAKSAVLIDSVSGRILYEVNSHEKLPMASTTKIMTGLLACESGKFNDAVKTSPFASGTEGSSLWLKIGEKQTLEDLTYGLMLKSGNDAAVAIAEHLAGNIDAFAALMNERAKKIGAINTSFKNPHGLDCEGHYTTSYDLALITREAMKNDLFRKIVSTKHYSIPLQGEKWDRAFKNHNKLLWLYEGCNGVKTGYTKKCGRCLVSSAERDGKKLICVTINAPNDWSDHTYLLDYGFENFKGTTVVEKGEKVKTFTYDKKYKKSVEIVAQEDCTILTDKNDVITTKINIDKITSPLKKGSVVGKMTVFCNDKILTETKLVTKKELKKVGIKEKIVHLIKNFFA